MSVVLENVKQVRRGHIKQKFGGFKTKKSIVKDEISDSELVKLSVGGDRDAYQQLVIKYQSRAFAIAFDILKSKEDAEDVVQESFVKAYLSLKNFKGNSSFYTWLYRITYNMSIDYRRKLLRRGGIPKEYDEFRPEEGATAPAPLGRAPDGPEQAALRKEQRGMLERLLGELSEEHRVVVTLREIDGLSYDEISKVLGVRKGTVMSRLFYARQKLQEALGEEDALEIEREVESRESSRVSV